MIYHVIIGERTLEVDVGADGIRVDGRPVDAALFHAEGSPLRALHLDGATHPVVARRVGKGHWRLRLRAKALDLEVVDQRTKAIRELAGAGAGPAGPRPIVAPMPGKVLKVEVREGDTVVEGQGVVIVEAMKMENELRAAAAGTVVRLLVKEGEAVEKDQVLVELAAPDAEGS